jgi:serine/threonine-protein kinase HipA
LLARELGFPAAVSTVRTFGDEQVIVIERYDRDRLNGILHRVHQEDMCQATGVLPTRKYEVDGGPGIVEIAELLRHQSSEPDIDVLRFVDSIALNWLIAGTDAHAKNYSVLHARGPQLRLAPLYDIITILPYPQLTYGMNKLAMAIGEERLISAIAGSHWRTLADEIGIRGDVLLERVANLAVAIPRAVDRLNATHASDETAHILSRLSQQVVSHCQRCLQRL